MMTVPNAQSNGVANDALRAALIKAVAVGTLHRVEKASGFSTLCPFDAAQMRQLVADGRALIIHSALTNAEYHVQPLIINPDGSVRALVKLARTGNTGKVNRATLSRVADGTIRVTAGW